MRRPGERRIACRHIKLYRNSREGVATARQPGNGTRAATTLQPQVQPAVEHVGYCPLDHFADAFSVITGAEMRGDDQLVLKSRAALDDIVQMDVSKLMDL